MRRLGRILLAGTGLAVALGVALLAAKGPASRAPEGAADTLGDYGAVPDFALVERNGRQVSLEDLRGKVWLANFIYTACTETCPLQSLEMSRLQQDFADAPDARFVSITVDPDHDTPAALAEYARRYRADPARWLFLTGSKAAIYALATDGFKLGVTDIEAARGSRLGGLMSPASAFASHGSKGLILHSLRLVLVDRAAQIRAYHRPDDPESLTRLRKNLRALLAER